MAILTEVFLVLEPIQEIDLGQGLKNVFQRIISKNYAYKTIWMKYIFQKNIHIGFLVQEKKVSFAYKLKLISQKIIYCLSSHIFKLIKFHSLKE